MPCLRLSIVPHRRLPPATCHAWSCTSVTSQRPCAIFSRHVTILDNETMAQQGFPGSTAERFRAVGRITGYMGEFAAPAPEGDEIPAGYDLLAATVVHLFDDPEGVSRWMDEIFIGEFCARVDQELHPGQRLLTVERLTPRGLRIRRGPARAQSEARPCVVDDHRFPCRTALGCGLCRNAREL